MEEGEVVGDILGEIAENDEVELEKELQLLLCHESPPPTPADNDGSLLAQQLSELQLISVPQTDPHERTQERGSATTALH